MKHTLGKYLLFSGMFLTLFIDVQALTPVQEQLQSFPTYFQYGDEVLTNLSEKKSNERMSDEELIKWDNIVRDLCAKNPLGSDNDRMYAYLFTAQRDVAYLSYQSHGEFMGSLGPITSKVLKLFIPSAPETNSDEYSEYLAQIVLAKVKQRLDDENAHMRYFPTDENDPKLKDLPKPYYGIKTASCTPWLLNDPKQFMAAVPPSQNDPYWIQQAEVVKKVASTSTEKQIEKCKFWAGLGDAKKGDSMSIAEDYMFSHQVPFAKIVYVRSILAEATIDVEIALYHTKYTYAIKRPYTINQTVPQHIVFPKHPSYPSGHSTWFSTWAILMTHYFPEEKDHWFELAQEAGLSRIWAGIHYPIDHQEGWALGAKLGNAMLQSPKSNL